ncbi:MAG: pilus assembly protein PilM, partial [Oscillospiraceae bacterium]|nr:pilus assembly protein PilM [Oscillospiraceae bacterium]
MLSFDVTDKQIKLVKGSLAGSKIRINAVETRDVPEGAIVNGYVTEVAPVSALITEMLTEKKISDKEIIVCINSGAILYKELEVIKPKSLKSTAAIEAMIVAQMGIANDYNVSYSIVGDGNSDADGNQTIKVMATACPQRMVDGYQLLFGQAGLKLKQINISNNCITRLIMNTPKLKESMPFLCIQVDDDFVNINLYENDQVSISRYIKIDAADYEDNPDYVNIAVFDNLFRMIQFIGQRPDAKPLKQIMFYGMIKDFVALSNSISSFNVPAHVLTMPNNIVKLCEVDFSKYANAIGAFYKVDPIMEQVNLLQSTAVKSKKSSNAMFPLHMLITAGVSAGLVFLVYFGIDRINKNVEKQIAEIDQKILEGEYDAKRLEMELMRGVLSNF